MNRMSKMKAFRNKFMSCKQQESTVPEGAILTTILATRNFSSRSIITKKGDGSQVKESTDSSTTIEDDDPKEDKRGGVDRSCTVIAKEPEAGSAGSGSSSGSSSNSQNSQAGASPLSPATVYLGTNHTPTAPASRRYDSSSNAVEVRRVAGTTGYVPLAQTESPDHEDGKRSNPGKGQEKKTIDEDACSKLSRCCLLS